VRLHRTVVNRFSTHLWPWNKSEEFLHPGSSGTWRAGSFLIVTSNPLREACRGGGILHVDGYHHENYASHLNTAFFNGYAHDKDTWLTRNFIPATVCSLPTTLVLCHQLFLHRAVRGLAQSEPYDSINFHHPDTRKFPEPY
jgi:hypothetical protein